MKMKINTYNYMKGKKIYMIKNIMGAAIAVALAAGVGTTGVRSNTTYTVSYTHLTLPTNSLV